MKLGDLKPGMLVTDSRGWRCLIIGISTDGRSPEDKPEEGYFAWKQLNGNLQPHISFYELDDPYYGSVSCRVMEGEEYTEIALPGTAEYREKIGSIITSRRKALTDAQSDLEELNRYFAQS